MGKQSNVCFVLPDSLPSQLILNISMFGKENSCSYESRETAKLSWNIVEEPFTVEVGVTLCHYDQDNQQKSSKKD